MEKEKETSEDSKVKLPHFDDRQRDFILEGLALGKRPSQITVLFRVMFPGFGEAEDHALVNGRIFERIRKIRTNNKTDIELFENGDIPQERKIVADATFRLSLLLDLYYKTPHLLSGEKQDRDNSATLLKIIGDIRLEMDRISGIKESTISPDAAMSPSRLPPLGGMPGRRNVNQIEEDEEESANS